MIPFCLLTRLPACGARGGRVSLSISLLLCSTWTQPAKMDSSPFPAWFGTLPTDVIAREILARVHIEDRARFTSTCKYLYAELGRRARVLFGASHLILRAARVHSSRAPLRYAGSDWTPSNVENPFSDKSQLLFVGYPTPGRRDLVQWRVRVRVHNPAV